MLAQKFSRGDLAALRSALLESAADSWDTARVLQFFLAGRGYGVSPEAALEAASRVGGAGCTLEVIQQELEGIALVM